MSVTFIIDRKSAHGIDIMGRNGLQGRMWEPNMTFSISNRVPKTVESLHHSFKIVSRTTCIQKYMYNLETDAALTRIYFMYIMLQT